jgi:hypothetical protein
MRPRLEGADGNLLKTTPELPEGKPWLFNINRGHYFRPPTGR